MWPNPLQYFLVPDIDAGENGLDQDSDEEDVDDNVVIVEEEGEAEGESDGAGDDGEDYGEEEENPNAKGFKFSSCTANTGRSSGGRDLCEMSEELLNS
uniref:Uncharacterized protein n=1 Tax=Romanomermis culicivorax TaxID=13658 RepID=A0A915KVD1_ROMCU